MGKGPKDDQLVFTCSGNKFHVYSRASKSVVDSITIKDHDEGPNNYQKPLPVPTVSESGLPTLYLFRDAYSLFLIDLELSKSHQILTGILTGSGLAQIAIQPVVANETLKELQFVTSTWYSGSEFGYGSERTRELVVLKIKL